MSLIRETQRDTLPKGIYHRDDIEAVIFLNFCSSPRYIKENLNTMIKYKVLKRLNLYHFKDTGLIV